MTRPARPATAVLILAACGAPEFTEPLVLGGVPVAPDVLNDGREAYIHYCYACHGMQGDGHGPSSPGLRPPPRDFRLGLFKFAGVASGELPHDEDLLRTIRRGLDGTPMLPWDIPQVERAAILQYVKTFSPRWKTDKPGQRILPTDDPWRGREAAARERGQRIFHLVAQCASCHPNYATRSELGDMSQELLGVRPTEFRPDLYGAQLKRSDEFGVSILPTDFLVQRVKNGETLPELYRTIAAGIGGAAMPRWQGSLPEPELWALVHYVKSLVDLRDTAGADELRYRLEHQPPHVPPAPAANTEAAGSP